MLKTDRSVDKSLPRTCILEEGKLCDNCCECFVCDLDPEKLCDNCAKCLESADYNGVIVEDIIIGRPAGRRRVRRKLVKARSGRNNFRLVRKSP